jgi:hypothetical protein
VGEQTMLLIDHISGCWDGFSVCVNQQGRREREGGGGYIRVHIVIHHDAFCQVGPGGR